MSRAYTTRDQAAAASAARKVAQPDHDRRPVLARLTDMAPNAYGKPASDDSVCRWIWAIAPLDFVGLMARRLERNPAALEARMDRGWPALCGAVDSKDWPGTKPSETHPLVWIWDGLTLEELQVALKALVAWSEEGLAA